ncbi:HD-GYP domain-containing protein [candidate division KSB1 bacterium]
MRRISIETLKPGMKLGLPIRDENDNILLNRQVVLTERYIQRLRQLDYQAVYIADPDLIDAEVEDMLSDATRGTTVRHLKNAYKKVDDIIHKFKNESIDKIKKSLQAKEVRRAVASSGIHAGTSRVVDNILDEVVTSAALNGLNSLKTHDNYTFNHSIDVTVVAIMLGRKLQFNGRQLQELAVGSLLHDIGKVFIPKNILNKPDKLTADEYVLVKEHATLGYELLKESIPILQSHIAFQHHERQDGSGYPRGITGCNTLNRSSTSNLISLYGEVAAIADVYDALSSDRPYRTAVLHDEVVDMIKDSAYSHFNAEMVEKFLSIIPRYPVGSSFRVTTGQYLDHLGVVIKLNENDLDNPKIRILFDNKDDRIDPIDIDLAKRFDVRIKLIYA